ncbi:ER-Golgi trafficking TRAPP 3 complex 85 [Gracilaria domingensis]|nr:ER-Golgi trafficking TRAPP 3 complex 85 [Gracilaria domingensis]
MGDDDAARRFKRSAAAKYAPLVQLSATQHCDAAVRTASNHRNVLSLLAEQLPSSSRPPLRLLTPAQLKETSPRSFARALLDGARDVDRGLPAVADTLKERLEQLTVAGRHEGFILPLLNVVAVWVCEPQITEAVSVSSMRDAPLVLLVARPTAQDSAALQTVKQSLSSHPAPLLVLRLGHGKDTQQAESHDLEHSVAAVAAQLDSSARAVLNTQLNEAVAAADSARRAVRSSFRSWFSTSSTSTAMSMPVGDAKPPPTASIGTASSSVTDATQLAPNTLAAATRRLGDLALMAGRYTDASDAYRMLASEVRTFSSAAAVHHASALELSAISLALIDGSNAAIGSALESAVLRYMDANRPELAARAALRAVDFCLSAGYPDSAAGVLVRAIAKVRPGVSDTTPPLVDAVLAVLCAACSDAFARLKHPRRASRFAFFAAIRFAKLRYFAAAAAAAEAIDGSALQREAVRHHVQYWMGEAALSQGNPVSAVRHFSSVLVEAKNSAQPNAVEIHASVVRAFLRALKIGAVPKLATRWDSGVAYPLLDTAFSFVRTHDMADCDREWYALEDEVLEDAEFFEKLASGDGRLKRERRIEALISELRHAKRSGQNDPGGSLEMKIRRMRDLANARKRRRRAASLLERGAVLGEAVLLHTRLRNPLQFPVFIRSMSAVVSLDGKCYSLFDKSNDEAESEPPPVRLFEAPSFTIAPNSEESVLLKITGQKAGVLQCIGVCWTFAIGTSATFVPDSSTVFAPGFALLHRHGRRLNDTRHQRASDVPLYEEDNSLTVTIAPLAPKLKTTLLLPHFPLVSQESLDPTLIMRAGEVRKGHLELKNEGTVALESIVFRVGTPQTMFLGIEPEVEQDGDDKRVFAVGMKEQKAEQSEVVAAGRVTLRLAPGHKTRVPLWIRAAVSNTVFAQRSSLSENIKVQRTGNRNEDRGESGPPLRDVKLAIAYGTGRLRMCRVSMRFRVHPSVMVSPRFLREADLSSISPGASNKIGCLFGVEVEHAGPSEMESVDFDITKLTVTSKHGWKPMTLPAPAVPMAIKRGDMRPSAHTLRINETATFFVFLVRDRSVKDGCEVNDKEDGHSVSPHMWETHVADLEHNSNMKNQDKAFDTVRNITVEPEMVEKFGNQDGDRWDRKAVTHFVVCSKHHSHIHRHGKGHDRPDRVYVTVGWRTNEENEGDIQIPSIDPLKWMKETKIQEHGNESVTASQDDVPRVNPNLMQDVVEGIGALRVDDYEKNPVQVRVSHPEKVKHDFFRRTNQDELGLVSEQSSLVAYPAVVPVDVLVKNVSNGVLDVAFAAPTEGGVADGERGRYWTGDASMSLRSIAPGAERTICLTAVLISPGQYNMCRFTMLYQTSSFVPNRRRQHISVSPSYMTVEAVGEYKLCEDDTAEEQHETAPLRRSSRRISTGPSGMSVSHSNPKRLSAGPSEDTTTGSKHSEEDKTLAHGSRTKNDEVDLNLRKRGADAEASRASERSGRGRQRESALRDISPARSGRGTSREGKSAQLLSELKNDAFWNDADTDED